MCRKRADPALLPHDYLFTDQQLDASIGLYWYASRACDPSLGRFTCPDSIVPSVGNPQGLNRFSYVCNNPLKYVDAQGHSPSSAVPWPGSSEISISVPWPNSDLRVDIEANIREASRHRAQITNPIDPQGMVDGYSWFKDMVKKGGDWDYRSKYGDEWEDFGNFHYGVVGTAAGISEYTLLVAAGWTQFDRKWFEPGVPLDFPSEGIPFVMSPYGDDHRDYDMIGRGIRWYRLYESTHGGVDTPVFFAALHASFKVLESMSSGVAVHSIPAGEAPGGVGVVGITEGNLSGSPEDGRGWEYQNAEARYAAWLRGGAQDHNVINGVTPD